MIEIRAQAFDPWHELPAFEAAHPELSGKAGACAVFVGTMRDFNQAADVDAMFLEHYPGMTEKHLHAACDKAMQRWPLHDVLVMHRVGEVHPGQPIVLVAAWSAHRGAAFDACRFVMEDLKSNAPFWKKETLRDGERWVDSNTPGYSN
ncbi:MAG: molybdenum cofactor biosynthesis protein MoaE [Gammaproteobacteria bacterium]|nr:molybdenum cofactor biosynthesis protein MoaE [Gammaproteobacteria bacterium]